MPDLETYKIKLTTEGDTAGADKVAESLNKVKGKSEDVAGSSEKTGNSFASMVSQFALGNIVANGVGDAFNFVKDQMGDVFKAADDNAAQQGQLSAAIKSTGDASGLTAEQANELADGIQRTTPISKDATLSAENMLMTFTGIKGEAFEGATKAADDMATKFNGGVAPSIQQTSNIALQLGKALNDPLTGMTALRREGVTFSDAETKQIKTMMAHNDVAGAQKVMLNELSTEFGGSAAAAADSYAGKQAMIANNMEEAKVKIGDALQNAIQPFAVRLAAFVSSDTFEQWIKNVTTAITTFGTWLNNATTFLMANRAAIATVIGVLGPITAGILIVVGAVKTVTTVMKIWNAAMLLIEETNPILLAITAIIVIGALLITHWQLVTSVAQTVWKDISGFFTGLWQDITRIWNNIVQVISSHMQLILTVLMGPMGALVYFIASHWNQILSTISNIGHAIVSSVSGFGNLLYDAGKNLIEGLINGVKGMVGHAAESVKNIGSSIVSSFKSLLGIHSPSTVFHEMGGNIGQGLVNGITGMHGAVNDAISGLANGSVNAGINVTANASGNMTAAGVSAAGIVGSNHNTSNTTNHNTTTIQQVVINTAEAANAFFANLDQDTINVGKGLTTNRGLY